ncbi:NUDIX hydrolase [Calothrix sp. PCC 6303]|uniref:NUDIX hydrolase n=1 Tax=Calothrix sp. PCC 6303 TaxID=1170562 RepID=UPI0002A021DB|nr:NUDIX domain-containing protein [Calothrix sp. PCC 6303]AFZ00084.1 NUDIX hydrolase [Calothrix sp. PCC 6303]
MSDKRRTQSYQVTDTNFRLIDISTPINFEQVTSVIAFPFTNDGKLVTVKLQRGLDVPGGHVQTNETSVEAVARRETLEEAAVTLGEISIIGIIESEYFGTEPDQLTYILAVTAFVAEIHPFTANEEVSTRLIITPEAFLEEYGINRQNTVVKIMANLVSNAQAYLKLKLSTENTDI